MAADTVDTGATAAATAATATEDGETSGPADVRSSIAHNHLLSE